MSTIDLLILQPTPFCNISCKYCYLPERSSKARMTPETIKQIFSTLFPSEHVGAELDVCWHAGEPLVLPVSYYRTAFNEIELLAPTGKTVHHHFQTNGMMIDDDWCDLFKAYDVKVGVSIDGPQPVNDANRLTRSGRSTFAETMAGIRCLQRNGIDFNVISVLGAASLDQPEALHEFYVSEGIKQVCFNVEEIEGPHRSSSLDGNDKEAEYGRFMREFWNRASAYGLYYIREFNHMLEAILGPGERTRLRNSMAEPLSIVSVDWQGNFSTFSPEFLGQKNARYGDFIIGNFWRDTLEDGIKSAVFQRLSDDIREGVEMCRKSCDHFAVCGGGSPVNKLYENGTLASTETMYCRLNIKTIADIVMEIIDNTTAQPIDPDTPRFPHLPKHDLHILGAGIAFPEHLTVQTLETMRACNRIFTNLTEPQLDRLPPDIRAKCVSLSDLYRDGRRRVENYSDVAQAVIDALPAERPVAWLTPGNPRIFDSVSENLIHAGHARGWSINVAPGISSFDTLLTEIGYDPAGGLLIFEATALVAQEAALLPSVATLLLQPCVFGSEVAHIDRPITTLDLRPLRDYLLRFYAPEWRCAFVRSAAQAGARHDIRWVQLRNMAALTYEAIAGSTLFLPAMEEGRVQETKTDPVVPVRASRRATTAAAKAGGQRRSRSGAPQRSSIPDWAASAADGARIVVFCGAPGNDAERVEISTGTGTPSRPRRWSYENGAIVPGERWCALRAAERKRVIAETLPSHFGHGISIVRLPPELLEPFRELRRSASQALLEQEVIAHSVTAIANGGTKAIARYVRRHFERGATDLDGEIPGGINVGAPGLPTVTVQPETNELIGLHLDDWYGYALAERARAPNRICLNLGCEDRFLLFVNMPIGKMSEEVERACGSTAALADGGTSIGRAFMSLFPSYPVFRLRVQPGEAYVAPTECLVHDGSSIEMATMDVTLQIRGRFELTAVA